MIVIRPILRWLGIPPVPIMATTTTICYVFDMGKPPPKWSVDQYVTVLCEGNPNLDYPSRLDELSSCKVTKLELYKEKNGLYHEFVLAYIRHSFIDKSGTEKIQTRVARLERIFKDAASSFDLTFKPDTPAPAVDSIVIHETKEDACASRDAYCCYVVDFSEPKGKGKASDNPIPSNDDDTHSNPPNILDLAVAACTLNEIAENYSLFNTMRYWFANNLCRLLAQGRGYTVELRNKYRYKAGYFKQFPALTSDGRITLCCSLSADALSPEARAKVVELGADSDSVIVPDSQEPPDASQFESEKTPSHFSQSTTITTNYYPKFIECHSKAIQRLRKADAEQNPERAAKEEERAAKEEERAAKEKAQAEVREIDEKLREMQKELLEKRGEREKAQAEVREKDEKLREIDEKLRERDEKLREKDEELERLRAALQMQSASSKEAGGSSAGPSSLAAHLYHVLLDLHSCFRFAVDIYTPYTNYLGLY
ncbi:hypothetical protein QCA50_016945 [Cerrena zonata]|uniref:Uncharacterized protein n=1 Tax=Cerrena zonata TaxID=2478898 RepID=A0AAW0FM06_9APHY